MLHYRHKGGGEEDHNVETGKGVLFESRAFYISFSFYKSLHFSSEIAEFVRLILRDPVLLTSPTIRVHSGRLHSRVTSAHDTFKHLVEILGVNVHPII